MSESLSCHRRRGGVQQHPRNWLRRAVLLCSVATGLVLVGDQTLAGALSRAAVRAPSLPSTVQLNLALFTSVAVSVHQSIGSMSERSFEVVSLIVLGLSLLGGGRALTRGRRTRRPLRDAVSQAAGPAEVVRVTTRADAPTFVRVPRRAAR